MSNSQKVRTVFHPDGWVEYVGETGAKSCIPPEHYDEADIWQIPYRVDALFGQLTRLASRERPPAWFDENLTLWIDQLNKLRQDAAREAQQG